MKPGDTIAALSSGALPSGVAVIRLSGPQSIEIIDKICGGDVSPRQMTLRKIRLSGEIIDEGLVAVFPGPHSFTGEHCAELHLHGSPAIVRHVLQQLTGQFGVRLAEAGEFTRRAFENGKLDLTQVEGLGDLIESETEAQRRLALERYNGKLSRNISRWRTQMLDLRAEIEAQLDFSDEGDVADGLGTAWLQSLEQLKAELTDALAGYNSNRIIREGFRIALAGAPNAGKSSLLNALAKSDLAIVSEEAGTTRDVREVPIDLGGQLVIFLDLAGLRNTASLAEAEGVKRARKEIAEADLILWLKAPDVADPGHFDVSAAAPVWIISTKSDLDLLAPDADFVVSAQSGAGLDQLMNAIGAHIEDNYTIRENRLVSHERDQLAMKSALDALLHLSAPALPLELAAEQLRIASDGLARLTGQIDAEHILDRLFASFCIGK